jgi:cytochrome c peroxidase
MHAAARAALLLAALAAVPAAAQDVTFSPEELRAVLAHGPWPVPATTDASNPVSGQREAKDFGERLFFDQRLSGSGKFSCGSCHVPERNWTDNRVRGAAVAEVERNTPTLMNVRLGKRFGWDGAAESIAAQSVRPILDARELASSPKQVADLVRSDGQFSCRYRKTFGVPPSPTDDKEVLLGVARALAAFQETFETPPTPFDLFRNALAKGERLPAGRYSDAAQRGLKLFVGKGNCASCHSGPNFSDGGLHDNGFAAYAAANRPDAGKDGRFKVPTLRHLFLTAPYGHHGEVGTMAEAVRHYSERGSKEVKPLKLSAAEQSDLVVFLESLSTFNNPWRPEDMGRCE